MNEKDIVAAEFIEANLTAAELLESLPHFDDMLGSERSPEISKPEVRPTIDTPDEAFKDGDVFYTEALRGPRDAMLSGPIVGGWGPGRYFQSIYKAIEHYSQKYGADRVVKPPRRTKGRWSLIIKNLKEQA